MITRTIHDPQLERNGPSGGIETQVIEDAGRLDTIGVTEEAVATAVIDRVNESIGNLCTSSARVDETNVSANGSKSEEAIFFASH